VPPATERHTELERVQYATGTRVQAHAPGSGTPIQRLARQLDPYLALLALILGVVLVLPILGALALGHLDRALDASQAPAASPACTKATGQVMATADAARKTEGAGAHGQHEAIEETLIKQAEAMAVACR
jgi:hypothetical protein